MAVKPPKTILLADDDADDCLLFEDALREICVATTLVTANDGVELMAILQKTVPPPPDVIFLDLNMPRKDGFECLREIRQTQKLKDIPVVIFSTSGQDDTIARVYSEGADIYIKKPGSFPKLKAAIKQILDTDWTNHNFRLSLDHFYFSF
jgi:CheY-like chemotaxis protein